MSPEEKLRLTHIAEAAALIGRYVERISKREFFEDTLRQIAVIRRIQIIGEAVRHLSHELLSNMPDFPAKEARGMRNILVLRGSTPYRRFSPAGRPPDPVVSSSTDQDGASPSKDGAAAMRSVSSVISEEGDSEVKVLPSAVERSSLF